MRTRTIEYLDLTEHLTDSTVNGELERLRDQVARITDVVRAMLVSLPPADLLRVYKAQHESALKYVGCLEDGGFIALTAPGVEA